MRELYVILSATLAFNAALVASLTWAYRFPRFAERRISPAAAIQVSFSHRIRTMATIAIVSLAMVYGVSYLAFDFLMHERTTAPWMIVLQGLAILLVYDFIYYGAHRLMHTPKMLRWVHGVHHRARNPSALESFYQHPVEAMIGLTLIYVATWIIGPVHIYSFALAFFVYSSVNILVHSGMDTRRFWLFPFDHLAKKHHVHHMIDPKKNLSSITLLPDLIFRTLG